MWFSTRQLFGGVISEGWNTKQYSHYEALCRSIKMKINGNKQGFLHTFDEEGEKNNVTACLSQYEELCR